MFFFLFSPSKEHGNEKHGIQNDAGWENNLLQLQAGIQTRPLPELPRPGQSTRPAVPGLLLAAANEEGQGQGCQQQEDYGSVFTTIRPERVTDTSWRREPKQR